jgi:hypothetical protein
MLLLALGFGTATQSEVFGSRIVLQKVASLMPGDESGVKVQMHME